MLPPPLPSPAEKERPECTVGRRGGGGEKGHQISRRGGGYEEGGGEGGRRANLILPDFVGSSEETSRGEKGKRRGEARLNPPNRDRLPFSDAV